MFYLYTAPKRFWNRVFRMISCKMSVTWKHAAENLSFSQLSQSMRLRVLRVVWFSSWHFTHPSLTFSKECVWICTTFSFSNSSPKLPIIPTQVVQTIKKTKRHNIAEKKLKWLLFYDVFAPKYFFWNNLFSRAPHKPSENRLSGVIYIVRALLMSHDSEWLPVILVPPPPKWQEQWMIRDRQSLYTDLIQNQTLISSFVPRCDIPLRGSCDWLFQLVTFIP